MACSIASCPAKLLRVIGPLSDGFSAAGGALRMRPQPGVGG
jgi:hypothetical protein